MHSEHPEVLDCILEQYVHYRQVTTLEKILCYLFFILKGTENKYMVSHYINWRIKIYVE